MENDCFNQSMTGVKSIVLLNKGKIQTHIHTQENIRRA